MLLIGETVRSIQELPQDPLFLLISDCGSSLLQASFSNCGDWGPLLPCAGFSLQCLLAPELPPCDAGFSSCGKQPVSCDLWALERWAL